METLECLLGVPMFVMGWFYEKVANLVIKTKEIF